MHVSPFLGQIRSNWRGCIIGLWQRARLPHAAAQAVVPRPEREDLAVRSS